MGSLRHDPDRPPESPFQLSEMENEIFALDGAGLSHIGHVRRNNEDAILVDLSAGLWAIADGMGGHGHGEVAANLVVEHLASLSRDARSGSDLVLALKAANAAIRRWSQSANAGPMGATVVAAFIDGQQATIAWAGDSRAYLWRAGQLQSLTRDHSVIQELLDNGRIDPADVPHHPQAHVVTRAVGASDDIDVDVVMVGLAAGDIILLCSDGLTGCVPEEDIAGALNRVQTADASCRRLVEAALDRGGPDNVSVVVVQADRQGPS